MDDKADLLLLKGVARPCPDCAEERLFVPVDPDSAEQGDYSCTWCGAGLLIDPSHVTVRAVTRDVA